jgi:hypothetical protein
MFSAYVEPTGKIRTIIEEACAKAGSQARFAKMLNCTEGSLSLWKLGKRWIPWWMIEKLATMVNKDALDLIDRHRIRGQNSGSSNDDGTVKVQKKMTSEKARLLGWVLTDGNIHSKRSDITIAQRYKTPLLKLISSFQNEFSMGPSHFGVYKLGDRYWRLVIRSTPLKFVLTKFYGVSVGMKCSTIRIPPDVFTSDRSTKVSFITAVLEGDGSFTWSTIRGKKYPRISIQSKSEIFILQLAELLKSLGYRPARYNSSSRKHFGLCLERGEDVQHFASECYEFMFHDKKRDRVAHLKKHK